MSTLTISGLHHDFGGPSMPIDMYARLGKREVTTNVMWPTLTLHIGATTVEICPINKEQVQQLAKRLTLLAEGMES